MSANNFRLTLDTTAPNGTGITAVNKLFTQDSVTVTLSVGDADYMKLWYDTHAGTAGDPTTEPGDTYFKWVPASTSATVSFQDPDTSGHPYLTGSFYVHAILMDEVGNKSAITSSSEIVVERILPLINTFYAYDRTDNSHTYTNERTFGIYVYPTDSANGDSGIKKITLSCTDFTSDIVVLESEFTTDSGKRVYNHEISFKSTATDGLKTIYVVAEDNCGNVSAQGQCQITLDMQAASASINLRDAGGGTTNWPTNVKTNSFDLFIEASDGTSNDIVTYNYWGDISGHTSKGAAINWPTTPSRPGSVTVSNLSFTSGQGTKTINVEIIDRAGNVTTVTNTYIYDIQAPSLTMTGLNYTGSQVTGSSNPVYMGTTTANGTFKATTLTITASDTPATGADACSGLVATGPTLTCNGSAVTPTAGTSGTWTYSFSTATAGTYTFVANVSDKAGNAAQSVTVVVIVEASVSVSAALKGAVLESSGYANYFTQTAVSSTLYARLTTTSTAPRSTIYAWIDNVSTATENPPSSGTTPVQWDTATQDVANGDIAPKNPVTNNSTNNYFHVKVINAIGNYAYDCVQFTVDSKAPTYNASLDTASTSSRTVHLQITNATDVDGNFAGSGINAIKIEDDNNVLQTGATDWTTYNSATFSSYALALKTTTPNGTYSVTVRIRDNTGNITTKTLTWEYDATAPVIADVQLLEKDQVSSAWQNKHDPSAVRTFRIRIDFNDTSDTTDTWETIQYKVYGATSNSDVLPDSSGSPGATAITESNASWNAFKNYDGSNPTITTVGQNSIASIVTPVYWCTTNPEGSSVEGVTKTVYIKLKDNAGNVSNAITATFVYNPVAATVTISNISHQIISCVHARRKQTSGSTVSDITANDLNGYATYTDMMSFVVTSTQAIDEWKVVAYRVVDQANPDYPASDADGSQFNAITKLSGSHITGSYSASNVSSVSDVTSFIAQVDGADFRNALGGSASVNRDGIHFIIVFVKNKAGTWSYAGTPNENA